MSWLGCLEFERGVRSVYPDIKSRNYCDGYNLLREYKLKMDVKHYDVSKGVTILFCRYKELDPKVLVKDSLRYKHIYQDGSLCMWYPKDPEEMRWVFQDGLLGLLKMIEDHLFKEAWWAENKGTEKEEWLGLEVHHS